MPQQATILCPADEPQRVLSLVRELIDQRGKVSVEGKAAEWSSITVRGKGASLVLNRRVFVKGGDEFSSMTLGMWTYFNRVETEHETIKEDVLRRVEKCQLAIGIVAEPEFVESAGHYDCVFGLAAALDAIIWNGSGVINAEGQMLLDDEGNCEVTG